MTIGQAIERIDGFKANAYTYDEKVRWLWELDSQIKTEIMDTHEGGIHDAMMEYTADDTEQELLVMPPYDGMYIHFLESKIDYANAEYGKFNNSNAMFATEYNAFRNWYNQTHLPLGLRRRYW